ncbi:MAG: cell division protein FtsZ, partial [Methanothrix sp.]
MDMKYIIDDAMGRAEAESRVKPSSMIKSDEELVSVLEELTTVIRVIGCGGGGSNTIDRLAECGIQGAELFAVNTDAQHLLHINADRRFLIGRRTTRGLGAGSLPAIGEEAAQEDIDEIKAAVDGADMVFVTCGLGGGTGTGASP